MGHDCELQKPGDYMTVQIGEYPIVIVRGDDGRINALHNSCRHRGSRVCTEHRGSATKLVCPYHQWTYDLEGKLLFARQMGDDFDGAEFGMKRVACETAGGYYSSCRACRPADGFRALPRAHGALFPAASPARGEGSLMKAPSSKRATGSSSGKTTANAYHCAGNHPELCKTYPEAPSATGVSGADDDPETVEHWEKCEAIGLPSRFVIDQAGQYRAARMPLLRDAVSYTISGRKAVQMRLSDSVNMDRIGTLLLFHYPTTWNHVLSDHAVTFRVLLISATETAVTTKWLVHKDAVEGIDYRLEELTHVWTETNDQDRQIVEENARGIASPAYQPGPYSEVHEGGVAQFVEWYSDFMVERLTGRPRLRSVA